MAVFLDTGNLDEIKLYHRMGIIRGVTTNPTIMLRCGVTGGMGGVRKRTIEIAELIHPLPLSVEVTSNDLEEMVAQGREFASWAENINVKITIHGPDGEIENLEAINRLENEHDVRVNATAMMSAQQCLLAALAGATYVSLFGGRVNDMGYSACEEITKLREVLELQDLDARIIIGSVREPVNVIEWIRAGAHIVTATPGVLKKMIVHPYSKETVKMFLDDAKKAEC
ncbi:MAG: transaldolase family protein [Pseudodesulfovibrio sp.]